MIPLLLSTVFSSVFGLVLRHAQRQQCNLWAVGALQYLTAALFFIGLRASEGMVPPSPCTWTIGLLAGIINVAAYFLLFPFMELRGVSIAAAVSRLAVLIPVLVSVVFWGERPNGLQSAGALLALISLPLLGCSGSMDQGALRGSGMLLLMAMFVVNGLCLLCVRGYHQTGVQGEEALFLGILFCTAALGSHMVWLLRRKGSSRKDLLFSFSLGICNALATLTLVRAVQQLPGVVVFPFYSSVGLILTAVFAGIVWKEQISRIEMVGMTLAAGAVVFINMG